MSDQVALGKRLSEKQIAFLDKLILKYGDQFDDLDSIKSELGLDVISTSEADESIASILELMENVSTWAEPVKRGKIEFNDKSFFDSLNSQFKNNGTLSDRQIGALKKMVARYADQIHNYHDKKDSLGLLEPRKPKEKKEEQSNLYLYPEMQKVEIREMYLCYFFYFLHLWSPAFSDIQNRFSVEDKW